MSVPELKSVGGSRTARPAHGRRRRSLIAWAFAAPYFLLFVVFGAGPVIASLGFSVTDIGVRDVRSPFGVNFVGLSNFAELFGDEQFRRAILNTLYFVAVGIPLTMGLGLVAAIALNSGINRLKGVFRVSFFAPFVTSIIAIAVVWRYLYQDDGFINGVLARIGIAGPDWLNDPHWAMPALIVMAVWRNIGLPMVIFLAGLQGIPRDVYEAAAVDGSRGFTTFWRITLPLLRPTTLVVAVLLSIGYLQFFEEPFVMTGGGPLDSTISIGYYAYEQFGFGEYGMAAAASYVLVAFIVLLSLLQFRIFRNRG
ncbi:carbohydrate ABC transporter permease [Demequina zhanjiangensis]|uniref:Sugar ABC transporter permease n=1 Tax=Demequina zhanjiangensis TaxID=3051659 RepID=A0ABT8FZP2_9MICO|nr:sugar ABC transporter permease [Demequina sp. SYSU T00b26]MDN4472179.1 sugar ABC transporter permease [Demequina sp. SYSU T00b26]